MNAHASSSAVTLDDLPPSATLQTWIHRPQAVAVCSVRDVYSLFTIDENNGVTVGRVRDVFLLGNFPCRFVELVAWVAGVDHKESQMSVYIDDGDGEHVLQVIIRLAERETPKAPKAESVEKKTERKAGFLSAAEREAAKRKNAGPSLPQGPLEKKKVKTYVRPDVRVGDTVKVVGRVDEWQRRTDTLRQVHVDMASGSAVVDPDDAYYHGMKVVQLHETLYSKPFTMESMAAMAAMPSSAPSRAASPDSSAKSNLSTLSSSIDMSSDMDMGEDGYGRDLPDPSKLSSGRLTEATFRLYMIDHMVCDAARVMKTAMRQSFEPALPILEAAFPEYRAGMQKLIRQRRPESAVFAPSSRENTDPVTPRPRRAHNGTQDSTFDKDQTPRASSFTSRMEERERLQAFTMSSLLEDERLKDLATRVVKQQARNEEKFRRRRAKAGAATDSDRKVVAERRERGVPSGDYHLSTDQLNRKMRRLVVWALRQASGEGAVVQMYTTDGRQETGYTALPPELLGPLIVPLVAEERNHRKSYFRPREERGKPNIMNAACITARLRQWGEEGWWERVGEWAVDQALVWAEERGMIRLKV